MSRSSVRARIEELRALLEEASYLYYNVGEPPMSDSEYDALFAELTELEQAHPELVTPDSPTQRVGAPLAKGSTFAKGEHLVPMLSIDSLNSPDEVREFSARAVRFLGLEQRDEDDAEADIEPDAETDTERGSEASAERDSEASTERDSEASTERDSEASAGRASEASTGRDGGAQTEPDPEQDVQARTELRWAVEPKLDGVSANLLYEDGVLVRGLSRGDGSVGEDITRNLRTIANLPLRLHASNDRKAPPPPARIEVRGEVILSRDAFQNLQRATETTTDTPFRNARNTVAGTLKLLDPKLVARRGLEFICWGVGHVERAGVATYGELYDMLRGFGFKMAEPFEVVDSIDGVIEFHDRVEQSRDASPYEMDGIVAKVDDLDLQNRLGRTARSPRWALAYKFAPRRATTRVIAIRSQVGRTGAITPVAELEPTELAGVTVRHATLHNWDLLAKRGVREGDVVDIERAGDVIPAVVLVHKKRRKRSSRPAEPPQTCPTCKSRLEFEGSFLYCVNVECPEQLRGRVVHLASRRSLDIGRLGPKYVDQLMAAGLLRRLEDVFTLPDQRERILELERWGEKSFDNLAEQIEAAKHPTLARFLNALGIRHVGEQTARDLATDLGTLDKVVAATEEELCEVDGVGPEVAKSIRKFFELPQNQRFLQAVAAAGLVAKPADAAAGAGADGELAGRTFCFTGGLASISRDQARAIVESLGAKTASAITPKVTDVVAGEKAGSKLDKAKKLGLRVLDETGFLELIGRRP